MNTGTNYIHLIARLRRWRPNLQAVGGYDNGLLGIPADGVREIISDAEAAADAIEKALPAITSWNNANALRTQIVRLTQNPYAPTDSVDSPQPEDK